MADGINRNNDSVVIDVISSDGFSSLNKDVQKTALQAMNEGQERNGGLMGKVFGIRKENAAMHIAFLLCVALFLLCAIDVICSMCASGKASTDVLNIVMPVISLTIGFIFGKGSGKE